MFFITCFYLHELAVFQTYFADSCPVACLVCSPSLMSVTEAVLKCVCVYQVDFTLWLCVCVREGERELERN